VGRRFWHRVGRAQQLPDAAGEVALEATDRLAVRLALGLLACDELHGLGVTAGAGDSHAVDRCVDLAVAAAVEAVPVGPA
jgi:hypothetical protein